MEDEQKKEEIKRWLADIYKSIIPAHFEIDIRLLKKLRGEMRVSLEYMSSQLDFKDKKQYHSFENGAIPLKFNRERKTRLLVFLKEVEGKIK